MRFKRILGVVAVGLTGVAALAGVSAWIAPGDQSAGAVAQSSLDPDRPETPALQTFTPRQFDAYAYNRTKAEIRDQFGSPDQVDESSDEWVYSPYSKRLAIEDMEAGKRVYVRITFFGDEGPNDKVSSTRAF